KIDARAREANPSHHAFDHHKFAVPATQHRGIRRLYHGKGGIAPYSYFPLAGLILDCKPLGGAATGLELRPDAGIAGCQHRRYGRVGRSVLWIDDGEIGDRPAPAIGSTGKLNDVDLASQQPFAQELARLVRGFRRAVVRVWSVQPAESHGSAVAEFDIEALIDADHLDAPGWPPAGRKTRGGDKDGQEPQAGSAEPRRRVGA